MDKLIGRSFRRNVHGLSLWTDIVREVDISWKFSKPFNGTQRAIIMVKGTIHWFPLEEVVFVRDLDFEQQLQARKEELHEEAVKNWLERYGQTNSNTGRSNTEGS